jgi:hypothetical protein
MFSKRVNYRLFPRKYDRLAAHCDFIRLVPSEIEADKTAYKYNTLLTIDLSKFLTHFLYIKQQKKTNSVASVRKANYTDRATAAWRS